MNTLEKHLKYLESKWLKPFFSYLESCFSNRSLPSHDQWHHLRVWHFVKTILLQMEQNGISFDAHEAKNLMLAAFFHDVGLIKTLDEWHGKAGADICREFVESTFPAQQKSDFSPAFNAIERHDDKRYKLSEPIDSKPSILSILSAGDDLDAFGTIGAVRYAEIYLLRGHSIHDLSYRVIENASGRLHNLRDRFQSLETFLVEQDKRYRRLINFYSSIREIPDLMNENMKILHHIQYNTINNHNKSLTGLLEPVDNGYIRRFRDQIHAELAEFKFTDYGQQKQRGV